MKDSQRDHGIIEGLRSGDEDGRFTSAWLFHHGSCGTQGFGGYCLDEKLLPLWEAELCALFGVEKYADIDGKNCWALRSFSTWNSPIVGLENMDGRRFIAADFFRRYLQKPIDDELTKRRQSLQVSIASRARDIERDVDMLGRIEADYVEWSALLPSVPGKDGSQ